MAQKCSALEYKNIPDDLIVLHNSKNYIPYGYEIKFKKGVPIHSAILHDINANSTTYADLGKVDKAE